jgi:arginase
MPTRYGGPVTVHLIGVPFDSAGTTAGVALGPSALRRAGLVDALRAEGLEVDDRGDVRYGSTTPDRDPESGIIAPRTLTAMIGAVRDVVGAVLTQDGLPLVLGGDCAVLLGCLAAFGGEPIGLLFVDGHEDAWPPHASTTGEAADMELGFLLGRATSSLPAALRAAIPRIDASGVVAIGPRDEAEIAEAGVPSIDDLVDVVRTEGMTPLELGAVVEGRIQRLDRLGRWWLHVDLDVLSTASLAAVGYQQPGGLDWSMLTAITIRALASPKLVGWTVTIYDPTLDPDRTGALAIVRHLATASRREK